jgi:hypothetical protein
LACCKGIFGGSGAGDSKPERYNETSNTWFTLENFLTMGCLCDDDIYEQDPEFFDAIMTFVAGDVCRDLPDVGTNKANGSRDTPVIGTIPSDKHPDIAGVGTCPNPLPLNGFMAIAADGTSTGVSLNKEEMMNKVLNMPARIPPAPPPLGAATDMSEIIADIHLYNFNADNLNTDAKREDLEDHIASQLAATSSTLNQTLYPAFSAADIQVEIQYFARGGVMPSDDRRRLLESSNENTVITIKIKPPTGVSEFEDDEVDTIRHVLLAWATARPKKDLGGIYGNITVSAEVAIGQQNPSPPTGTAPGAVPPTPPATLPPAVTGLPRQGTAGAYEGGFELTNTDYLLSLVGQAMPGFAMAIILMVVMILMVLVYIMSTICGALCCKCCNGAYKPRKFTKKDLVINKVVILVFVALTAAGCFMIFSEGPALLDGVSDLTQAMVDTVLELVDNGRAIAGAINSAATDESMALGEVGDTMDEMDEALDTVEEAIEKAQDQIEAQLDAAGSLILAAAGAMFALSFVVFAAAFIGWWRLLILFIVVLSLGMVLAWIVWGIVAMVTTLVDDLCWAMQDYLDNPDSSDLGDLIPCMDAKTALDTMTLARSMSSLGIVGVNSFLEDYAGTNPYQNYMCYTYVKVRLDELCTEENEYFNDDFTKYVCKAYFNEELDELEAEEDGHQYVWADAKCPFPTNSYKVKLGDFANEPNNADAPGVANLRCPFQGFEVELDSNGNEVNDINGKPKANLSAPIAFSMGQCYAYRQIPSDMFDRSSYSAELAQGIIDIIPIIEGLLQCEFVDNAFARMVGPCEDMAAALTNLYTAFLLVSLGYFLTWASTLVVISRLQYYKTGCTDAGDRYKQ